MCKLDCSWLSPYLFVSLGGWPFGIRVQPGIAVIRAYCREPGGSPQPGKLVSAPPGPVRPELEYGTLLQSYIAVLQHGIRHVSVRPSWMCVGAFPDAASLQEIVDCFTDNIGLITCQDLTLDLAPGFTCRTSDLITLLAYRVFSVSFVQPLSRLTSSGQRELIKECFTIDVSTLSDPCVLFVQPLSQTVFNRGN